MSRSASIRLATSSDAAAIADIYRPHCESTSVSFETTAPSAAEFTARVARTTAQFPWLVLDDDEVVGYAYAGPHHERAAYAWSVNVSVYVRRSHHRRGVGRSLYTALFVLLRAQGYFRAYGGITLPNAASTALHESFGFRLVGIYRGVGYKHGVWHDVGWYEARLQPERAAPPSPVPIQEIRNTRTWADATSAGLTQYRP